MHIYFNISGFLQTDATIVYALKLNPEYGTRAS